MVKKFWLKVKTLFTFVRNLGGIYLFDKKKPPFSAKLRPL